MMVLAVLLIILTYKKRHYAGFFIYFEAFRFLSESIFAMDGWNTDSYMQIVLLLFLTYVVLCTGPVG